MLRELPPAYFSKHTNQAKETPVSLEINDFAFTPAYLAKP